MTLPIIFNPFATFSNNVIKSLRANELKRRQMASPHAPTSKLDGFLTNLSSLRSRVVIDFLTLNQRQGLPGQILYCLTIEELSGVHSLPFDHYHVDGSNQNFTGLLPENRTMSLLPEWVDTHAHVTHAKFTSGYEKLLENCAAEGVRWIVSASTCADDAQRLTAIAAHSEVVRAAVGIHPNDTHLAAPGDWEKIARLAHEAKNVVAIGETGLDRYWKDAPFEIQTDYFQRHLDLAESLNLPVVIHCRDAMPDILALLEARNRPVKGTLHCFIGSTDDAQRLVQLGLNLGIGGISTFTNKEFDTLREVIRQVPADRLLVETDAPFLSPHPFRGKTNEPARAAVIGRALATLRGWTEAECAALTTANAARLFGLK